jgi:hypothetical protein
MHATYHSKCAVFLALKRARISECAKECEPWILLKFSQNACLFNYTPAISGFPLHQLCSVDCGFAFASRNKINKKRKKKKQNKTNREKKKNNNNNNNNK